LIGDWHLHAEHKNETNLQLLYTNIIFQGPAALLGNGAADTFTCADD
jgi:hypothetical protein